MKPSQKKLNNIYQIGIADAFINGLYKGTVPVGTLKTKGDFGLGAPDLVDGELTLFKGKIYQTTSNGITRIAPDTLKTPFAFVSFFKPERIIHLDGSMDKEAIQNEVGKYLSNQNGIYAIRISGIFDHVRTRAFSPVTKARSLPLAQMLDQQVFFDFQKAEGVLIGYKFPSYLAGVNIAGYHFHFLTAQLDAGGHAVDFSSERITVEISRIAELHLVTPDDLEFRKHQFKQVNRPGLEKVEKGN